MTQEQSPRRRRRPLSAQTRHLADQLVVHAASRPSCTAATRSSTSAGCQSSTSTEDPRPWSPRRTDPGHARTVLERFRSLETLPTTRRGGSSERTRSGRIPPTTQPAPSDSRQAATRGAVVHHQTASDRVRHDTIRQTTFTCA